MTQVPHVDVRLAGTPDYNAILAINSESRPGVASLDRSELGRLVRAGAVILVAEIGQLVAGYLIAFRHDALYDGQEFRYFKEKFLHDFIYVDQIAIGERFRRCGVGSILYRTLFEDRHAPRNLIHCCEVNLVPPNPISMAFHLGIGFRGVGEMQTKDGRTVELLVRKSESNSGIRNSKLSTSS